MTYLSPHFTLEEMTFSQEAARRGLDNRPGPDQLEALRRTCIGLEGVRIRLGDVPIIVSSGFRAPAVNEGIGGAKNSQHLLGEAADFTAPHFGTPRQIVDALANSDVPYDQLILEFGRWVHISFSEKPRRQALVIDASGTRQMYG